MKMTFLSRFLPGVVAGILALAPAFAQVQPGPPPTGVPGTVGQLPQGFYSQVLQEYNAPPAKEIAFPPYYGVAVEKYFQATAISLDPTIAYRPDELILINSPCLNGDFEAGTIGWNGGYGFVLTSGVVDYPNFVSGIVGGAINLSTSHQTIVGPGTDPNVPVLSTVAPGGSTQALRLGNAVNGYGAELISKTFTVTSASSLISFWYALVLQDPGHAANIQPSFKVRVLNSAGVEIPGVVNLGGGSNEAVANSANPFFQVYSPGLVYKNWSCAQINLTGYVGQNVTVQFVTKDCGAGGHYGYAYIDNFCGNCGADNPTGSISLDTANSTNCGVGKICVKFKLPQIGTQTGTVVIKLNIYQNGVLLTTLTSPTLTAQSGKTYCFPIDPATIPGLNASLGGFDFTFSGTFTIGTTNLGTITVGVPATGQDNIKNNDYLIDCPQCCPGTNLIKNPGFESGNTGFLSSYVYQPTIGFNSVISGQYGIMTSAQAPTVSSGWTPNCAAYGRHLIVNGATETTGSKVVWTQTVTVQKGIAYKFCVDLKNLPQCNFDVKPKVSVKFSDPTFDIAPTIISTGTGTCNWQRLTQLINLPGTGTTAFTITIVLDETGLGDGNDLAVDNISLVQIPTVALSQVLFNLSYINVTGTSFGLAATPVSSLTNDCRAYWEVAELDANGDPIPSTQVINPPSWPSSGTNTFNGYNGTNVLSGSAPGVFDINKRYRIIYGRWCDCKGFRSYAIILEPDPISAARTVTVDENYQLPADRVARIMNGTLERTPAPAEGSVSADLPQRIGKSAETPIRVFPNPTEDKVTVVMPASGTDRELKLLTPSGQLLKTIPVKAGQTTVVVPMKELSSGVYMLQLFADKKMLLNEKVVKL